MKEKTDSSLVRMLSVLDLFAEHHLNWTAEGISEALQVSVPTGYRYVRVLTESGLLQRSADAQYSLGPRIMVLDHYIRQADIVLQHAIPFMKELRTLTGFDCVVSGLYGQQILDTHQELSATPSKLSYGRGRPRPLFRGAAPKVILASFTPAHLRKVFDANIAELGTSGLPLQWPDFRKQYSSVHKAGYYLSMGEVDQDIAAIAVPLVIERKGLLCALTLVTSVDRMNLTDQSKLIQMLQRTALDIKTRIP